MILPLQVTRRVEHIKDDKEHGAHELTVITLNEVRTSIEEYQADDAAELHRFFLAVLQAFAFTRPSMSSIANSMATIMHDVDTKTRSVQGLRESIITAIEKQVTHLEKSVAKVVSHSANLIADEYTVMTCSYSSTVFKVFLEVQNMGRRLTVLTVRSPSLDGSIDYGVQMYKKLQNKNLQTAIFDDEATEKQMRSVHMILVGADSLLSDGSIVNGSPTLQLAYEAARKKKPFYVACETWKVNPTSLRDFTPSIEVGMDLVPSELVTAIVTENGLHDPKKIHKYSIDFSKRLKTLDKK